MSDSVTPGTVGRQASLSFTISRSLLKPMSIEPVMPSNCLIFCHPLLLLPSIFPSITVFSNESDLRIRWHQLVSEDTKGTFHAKMGTIKDKNGNLLIEAEEIMKRWPEYTELYKKALYDPDNHSAVITHLEPDILECEVKWALGSIAMNKAIEGDGILAEIFQILKDDAVKVLHPLCQQIWKTQQWPNIKGDWKRSVFTPIPKKSNTKECSNYHTIARMPSRLCSKSCKLGFSST